ncbi:hypothetical protein GmHk_14G041541 [Glycine max]|nr:hypothetical protein GmHk_14G041541 [Glycine max]
MGTRGCINYNPMLTIRQLGYPMRGAPSEDIITPFVARGFNEANAKILQRIRKAWNIVERKDKRLRGSSNGVIGGYHKWLKSRTGKEVEVPEESEEVQALKGELEKTRVVKEKLKMIVTRVRKECDMLRDVNMTTVEELERETNRARKEEWSRNKFRGDLWDNGNGLKLRKAKRDESRMESMVLEDKLKACQRSKRSLTEQLSRMEENMLTIIDQYKEKMNLAASHRQRLEDEHTKVSALQIEREARERVIESFHEEAMKWMNRFALTLNGSQELPRLLARAKAMADAYSAPDEVHGLFDYCQYMEQMKADMEAMKDQMATMMEAMLSMKKIMESITAAVATTSAAVEVDLTHPSGVNKISRPILDVVGQRGEALGSTGEPHVVQSKNSFLPYGLPPNYAPPNAVHVPDENADHFAPPATPVGHAHFAQPMGGHVKNPGTTLWPTSSLTPDMLLRGQHLVACPSLTPQGALNIARYNPYISGFGNSGSTSIDGEGDDNNDIWQLSGPQTNNRSKSYDHLKFAGTDDGGGEYHQLDGSQRLLLDVITTQMQHFLNCNNEELYGRIEGLENQLN